MRLGRGGCAHWLRWRVASLTQTSMSSSLSADASSMAFVSTAADLVAGDTTRAGGGWDAFRFDSPFQLSSDTAAPEISCASADGAWHASDVTLHCTASDAGLGLASAGDASFDHLCREPRWRQRGERRGAEEREGQAERARMRHRPTS